jgi:hypothetical protein
VIDTDYSGPVSGRPGALSAGTLRFRAQEKVKNQMSKGKIPASIASESKKTSFFSTFCLLPSNFSLFL